MTKALIFVALALNLAALAAMLFDATWYAQLCGTGAVCCFCGSSLTSMRAGG